MRNRLTTIDARNKRYMNQVLTELSRRIGFRVAPGFSERVIYRELFLQGLTVLDIMDVSNNVNVSMSHITARQEVRDLLKTLKIEKIDDRISELRTQPEKKDTKKPAATKKKAAKAKKSANDDAASKPKTAAKAKKTSLKKLSPAAYKQEKAVAAAS